MDLNIDVETDAFARWSRDFARKTTGEIEPRVLRMLGFEFVGRVVIKTPVDTGRARGGWLPYIDSEANTAAADGMAAGASRWSKGARAATGDKRPTSDGLNDGRDFGDFTLSAHALTITNGVPYIVDLEYNHSDQFDAPVRRAMNETATARGVEGDLVDIVSKADREAGVG